MIELKTFLKSEFTNRKSLNSRYSQKAFSRDIGISPTALNDFLAGRRDLNFKNIDKVFSYLNRKVHCSWCDKAHRNAKYIIGGPRRQFICDSCVDTCVDIAKSRRVQPLGE